MATMHKRGDKTFNIFNWSTLGKRHYRFKLYPEKKDQSIITAMWQAEIFQITIPFTDSASVENAIHCWCVLLQLKIPHAVIQQKMQQLATVAMRLELKNGINNCSIINDSYSADLSSLKIALIF